MKKIYTLLTSALLGAACASAAAPAPIQGTMHFSQEGAEKMRHSIHMMDRAMTVPVEGYETYTRAYTSGSNQYIFSMVLDKTQTWADVLAIDKGGEEGKVTFEEFPFYVVRTMMTIINLNTGQSTARIPQFLMWPAQYIFQDQFEEVGDTPIEKQNLSATLPSVLCNTETYCKKFKEAPLVNGGMNPNPPYDQTTKMYENWLIMNQDMMQAVTNEANITFDGAQATTICTTSRASEMSFKYYVENNGELAMSYACYLNVKTASGSTVGKNVRVSNYAGFTNIDGWVPRDITYPIAQLHIFNAGECSRESMGAANPYPMPWGPVRRLYVMGFGNDLFEVGYKNNVNVFNSDDITAQYKTTVPPEEQLNPDNQTFFQGALYAAADNATPYYGHWTIATPYYEWVPGLEEFGPQLQMIPEPGTAIPPFALPSEELLEWIQENDIKVFDEAYISYDGWMMWLQTYSEIMLNGTHIDCGTTDGFVIYGHDSNDNTLTAKFDGDIFYHADPNNCQQYEAIPAVGTLQGVENVTATASSILVANGAITVSSTEDAAVAIYNVNGQTVYNGAVKANATVSVELPAGLYLVKAGKESKKVML